MLVGRLPFPQVRARGGEALAGVGVRLGALRSGVRERRLRRLPLLRVGLRERRGGLLALQEPELLREGRPRERDGECVVLPVARLQRLALASVSASPRSLAREGPCGKR